MRFVLLALCCVAGVAQAQTSAPAPARMAFWNLTASTITDLAMAPAGTGQFGANQCANDRDGEVDHDERLRLTGVTPGRWDVRVTNRAVRRCVVRDVEVKAGGKYAFSLSDADLAHCQ